MAIQLEEILQVCRFCLCQDEETLIPLEDILDFGTTIQDVALLTGIQINKDNIAAYAMCLECTAKLKCSITFRNSCLNYDPQFQELCAVLKTSVKESYAKTLETIDLLSNDSTDLDVHESEFNKPDYTRQSNDESLCSAILLRGLEESCDTDIVQTDVFTYSANYIQPGEILYSESEEHSQPTDWNSSLNPPAPLPDRWRRVLGKRKLHLCDICGKMVLHIPAHILVHRKESTFSCPHCDMKAKQKTNLVQHIKQVHMKIASKTCHICGKSFIHHKTYRYHMLTHEGKSFECQDCSKTFSNIIYLRDHINRLHNAGRQVRKRQAGERAKRKRNRSRNCVVGNAKQDK